MTPTVLQLIGNFNQGGSERQAIQLVQLLAEDGRCNVLVGCLEREGVLLGELTSAGFSDIPEFPLRSFYDLNMIRQVRRCAEFMRSHRVEIIQTHDFYTNIFGMAAGLLARTPVRIAAKRETGTRTSLQSVVERLAFRQADSVVANSLAVSRKLMSDGVPKRKIVTIYNGIDALPAQICGGSRDQTLTKLGLPPERRFVTIVANVKSVVKNHRMFLRAALKVAGSIPDADFVIAGEGGLMSDLRAFASEIGLGGRAHFIGRCTDVDGLVSISDVCCLTSFSEGFSNSILEYMRAGKPVVATNVGGAGEVIEHGVNGYLVDSDDSDALAARVAELLNEPEKAAAYGQVGKATVLQKFAPARRLEKTLALYEILRSKKESFAAVDMARAQNL